MPRSLHVSVVKDGETFLQGTFDVSDGDYAIVNGMLPEVKMDHGQAASLLAGYMHARDVGHVTEDMGKIAMFAVVYMLEAGETNIEIPFEG
ncbi:hypothetical protein [Kordiimonas gwangyangensis]|uniref:hypothetical protein n=1 Tax=Kordiimonas gwangyangensis TaxID=288022 RepID=UPI00037CADC6|nr:hypothetical protein [Kordiimonas gwangyangensis]